MDISKLFNGHVDVQCPECNANNKVSAQVLLSKTNNKITCKGCRETIVLDNQDAIKQTEKVMNDLKRTFRRFK